MGPLRVRIPLVSSKGFKKKNLVKLVRIHKKYIEPELVTSL